jgi:hypothetical protein
MPTACALGLHRAIRNGGCRLTGHHQKVLHRVGDLRRRQHHRANLSNVLTTLTQALEHGAGDLNRTPILVHANGVEGKVHGSRQFGCSQELATTVALLN